MAALQSKPSTAILIIICLLYTAPAFSQKAGTPELKKADVLKVMRRVADWQIKSWQVLISSVHADGMLGYVQPVGAAPAVVDENSTETYRPGAFLLAGSQLYQYLKK